MYKQSGVGNGLRNTKMSMAQLQCHFVYCIYQHSIRIKEGVKPSFFM
ncbi:hypothetical protein CLL_A3203 [Clostridium botulinum B str. Eklund 17B (NRP)]|uniref:Uncharacterized protein n=1 Tax=Clostridium botulinum (strain Eklund 17B / Type B) TaxID=935198 RepID=B2TQD2_CLOBB|nr:hypothetical protein CLL_A3203 [Clostridium botulinum B str. Eklund 17B (NRP)]